MAYAALIAAGLDGIENERELPPQFVGDAYTGDSSVPEIPGNLRAAAQALNESTMLRSAMGDDVIDHYVRAAQWEQEACDRAVTDWDVFRGFERA